MLVRLTLLLLIFITTKSLAQFDFVNNPTYNSRTKQVDSIFNLDNTYDFQFRLSTFGIIPPHISVFILTVTGNNYSARLFKMENVDSSIYDWRELPVGDKDLQKLWDAIYKQKVFELPSFVSLLIKHKEMEGYIGDATSYTIEYSSNNKKNGASGYSCPNLRAKLYPHIKELKRMSEIIRLVYNHIGKGWKPC